MYCYPLVHKHWVTQGRTPVNLTLLHRQLAQAPASLHIQIFQQYSAPKNDRLPLLFRPTGCIRFALRCHVKRQAKLLFKRYSQVLM